MANMTTKDVVDRYNQALGAKDFAAARGLLADNLHFQGPIDRFDRADDYIGAITRLYGMVSGVNHEATLVQDNEVAVFYILDTPVAKAPVAEWYTVREGKITHLRAYFDA
jgi:SnoaL-like protein